MVCHVDKQKRLFPSSTDQTLLRLFAASASAVVAVAVAVIVVVKSFG